MSEYLPNGNGNSNGNGHDKIFTLNKQEDPLLSRVVPEARRRVCQNTKIPESARMFFCWLTDMSLLYGQYIRRGVVKFSDSYLAARFAVSDKTIRNWKRWLEATGEVWLTEKWMKNSFPQTVYNIKAIVGEATLPLNVESDDGSLVDDQIFSSNRRRQQSAFREPGTGKFASRMTPPRPSVHDHQNSTLQNPEENARSGKILPPSTAIDCRPPRQMVAAHHGNPLPTPTANGCRPARKTVAAVGGNELPRSTANGFRGARKTVADKGKAKAGELSIERGGGSHPAPISDEERAFKKWDARLDDMRNSDLRKLEDAIQREYRDAQAGPAKELSKRKLVAVRLRLLGPVAASAPKTVATAKVLKKPAVELTDDEILTSALQTVNAANAAGIKPLLTDKQRTALAAHGHAPK